MLKSSAVVSTLVRAAKASPSVASTLCTAFTARLTLAVGSRLAKLGAALFETDALRERIVAAAKKSDGLKKKIAAAAEKKDAPKVEKTLEKKKGQKEKKKQKKEGADNWEKQLLKLL